jgi:hypothetical protein
MKTIKTILIILVILVLIPLVSWLVWGFSSGKPLNIMVLNKTVLSLERKEHRALFWFLIHEKYTKPDGKAYNMNKDYFGFHPIRPEKTRKYVINRVKLTEIDKLASTYDMTYFADTYGIFFNEWYRGRNVNDKGTLIEGGLNNNDYLFLKKMYELKKLIIAEYNFFATPTDDLVRSRAEDLLGIEWSGWIGKYFNNLSVEKNKSLPIWIVELYNSKSQTDWDFKGAGIVLVNEITKDVIVLEAGKQLDSPLPEIQTTEYGKSKFDVPENVNFCQWFEISYTEKNRIIAEIKIHINIDGKPLLDKYNLPSRFPAIIESGSDAPFYYFTGDFTEYPVKMFTARLAGIGLFKGLFYNNKPDSPSKFYWTYYQPLLGDILENYRLTLKK